MYDTLYSWAFSIGMNIKKKDEELLRKLIFEIRAEETPGRFLEKLANQITDYRTNRNINLDVSMHGLLFEQNWFADKFYYMKSSVLGGLLGALSLRE
ncbi:hypothetical protein Ngar_c03870 [Candidatus Nitrososphaera gargensis Ga9.2]|uniref:Uncharacterized protein n=2 Tax=Candidatus Nitrososphaera gargensis TaxID=497727 RepID=K0ICK1_NITGG|nr:hypothetical protein Ngar_c03870 [Candidatus Nitrososphaera gargensis Ga9.2]